MYSGQVFKDLSKSDYNITKFVANKGFSYNHNTYSGSEIRIGYGEYTSSYEQDGLLNSDGLFKFSIYDYVNTHYYKFSSSRYFTFSDEKLKMTRSLGEQLVLISIPQQLFGSYIQKGTLQLEYDSKDIRDDSNGNLYDLNSSSKHVGNVFYDYGDVIITDTGSYYTNFSSHSFDSVSWNGCHTIYQHEILCQINRGEFACSTNPSFYNGYVSQSQLYSGSGKPIDTILSSSNFGPYITSIGLYDSNYELMAIAKVPKPIKNDPDLDIGFVIRWDE